MSSRTRMAWALVAALCPGIAPAAEIVFDPAGSSPFRDLQEAVDAAADGDTVLVAPGEHVLGRPLEIDRLHDPENPSSPPPRDIAVRSIEGPESTVLRLAETIEDPGRASVVIFHGGATGDSVIEGFTITGGRGTIVDCAQEDCRTGGGILVQSGAAPTLTNLRIIDNASGSFGGSGIHCEQGSSPTLRRISVAKNRGSGVYLRRASATLEDCEIRENHSFYEGGGGGLTCIGSSPTLTRCIIDSNKTDDDGGGVNLDEGSNAVFTQCVITRNSAGHYTYGMGIYCRASSPRFTDCRFVDNSWADYSAGGGLYCDAGSAPVVTRCVFSGNTLTCGSGAGVYSRDSAPVITECSFIGNWVDNGESGAAIHLTGVSSPVIRDCTIRHNMADWGGGIYCGPGATPLITGCSILENHARAGGGGIAAQDALPELAHCTIVGNTSTVGGSAVYSKDGAEVRLRSSIVHDNPGRSVTLDPGAALTASHSAVEGGWPGEGNTPEAPLFCGWGDAGEVQVSGAAKEGGDGSPERPFARLADALDYSLALAPASPCIGGAEDGSDMGAPVGRCDTKPTAQARLVRADPGDYLIEDASLFHQASVTGAGASETVLEGTVRGLRVGATLSDMTVTKGRRAGVFVSPGQSPSIARCVIQGNSGPGLDIDGGSPFVTDCTIAENRAGYEAEPGAGISARNGATPTILRTTIARNDGDYNAGGIFLSKSAGSFVECRILENVTQSGGGGLHSEGSTASFERCVFQGNEAQTGGAVESQESQDVFVNCLLVGNIAGEGGAVMVKWNGSGPRLRNCTIAANAGGPAIYCYNTAIEIRNSIIWGNSGGGILTGSEATPVVSHSCVQGDALWEGPGNIAEDPLFESLPLESHPGDFRLRAGSPAIDAGEAGEAPLADLEGNERPCGSGPDMGAYERCDRPPEIKFRRGEVDGSPSLTISDAIAVLQFLFSGASEPGCLDAADADDSGALDLIDPIGVLEYLFLGAGAPPEPGPSDCGVDPTPDALACAIDEACP